MAWSSHLCQHPWNGLTSWGFPIKIFMYISLLGIVCPVTLSSFMWWNNNVLHNVVCSIKVLISNFVHPAVASFFLRLFSQDTSPNFWHTLRVYLCIVRMRMRPIWRLSVGRNWHKLCVMSLCLAFHCHNLTQSIYNQIPCQTLTWVTLTALMYSYLQN
jgi:hypothetical protein